MPAVRHLGHQKFVGSRLDVQGLISGPLFLLPLRLLPPARAARKNGVRLLVGTHFGVYLVGRLPRQRALATYVFEPHSNQLRPMVSGATKPRTDSCGRTRAAISGPRLWQR